MKCSPDSAAGFAATSRICSASLRNALTNHSSARRREIIAKISGPLPKENYSSHLRPIENETLVISLRKHIDAYAEETAEAQGSAYRNLLLAIARAAVEATPYLGDSLPNKLKSLNDGLPDSPEPELMRQTQREADREITAWSGSASAYLRDKAKEVREIMIAVATATASTTERDQRYSGRFQELTAQLRSIARLEDLTSVRQSLLESADELKSCTERMSREGAAAISQLTAELSAYRKKLEESERRETQDVLTGLLNRRGLETRIEERILSGRVFSVAMFDLNGFKNVNDHHGHLAGDEVLRQFGAELQTQLKPAGVVARWGGDEFVAIMLSTLPDAETAIERVRRWAFGSYRLKLPGKSVQVTVTASAGLVEWNGRETSVELLTRADQRMYADKRLKFAPER